GEHFKHESIDEMKDADELIERILYLEGIPNLQRLNTVRVGETPAEKISLARDGELDSIERLNRGIALCVTHADNGTRELLDKILRGEESHLDWVETQLELISQLGEAHYLAQQIHD
ncbi:MAG: bacterioferritin, partial [Ilumatobacteraceae bacterium]|nr:bacterioferritin [Ilumatobacteraceae bacterium]